MWFVLLAGCFHGPPAAPVPSATGVSTTAAVPADPPSDPGCLGDAQRGIDHYNNGDAGGAVDGWKAAYARCGSGYGLLGLLAGAEAGAGHFDAAVDLVLQEYSEPFPALSSLSTLVRVLPSASDEARGRVSALGGSAEAPIVVPDVRTEYVWIDQVLCGGTDVPVQQSLVYGPRGSLDRMDFNCAGRGYSLFFDYSADPVERQMMKELGLTPE